MRFLILLGVWVGFSDIKAQTPTWQEFQTPVKASLRGLSPVSDQVCWASGSGGVWLRTTDGGNSWTHGVVGGLDTVDFRSIHAFDETRAVVASAGQPAVIYLTGDGGISWEKVHQESESAFFDAITFIDSKKGFVLGDPVGGKWMILETLNGGKAWSPLENLPTAQDGEAAFAASSSSLVAEKGQLILGTGGSYSNLYFYSFSSRSWEKKPVPLMIQGLSSQGIFAILNHKKQLILVGGDFTQPEISQGNLIIFSKGLFVMPEVSPGGYRSGIASLKKPYWLITVGPEGSDFSENGGQNWKSFSNHGYHSVKSTANKKIIWASGSKGRIAKLIQ